MPIKINGATSGSTTITAPATGGDESIELSTALASKLDLAGGKILQVVRATDSTLRSTTSTSLVDVTGMSVTITPSKSDSAVIIIAAFQAYQESTTNNSDTTSFYAITDSSNNVINGTLGNRAFGNSGSFTGTMAFATPATVWAYATPATTSAVTYKLRFRSVVSTNTTFALNDTSGGTMYAIEVSA